jgi:hypothetical protein
MAITTHIDSSAGLRHHKVTGVLSTAELRQTLDEVYARPDFSPEYNAVWDLREADVSAFTTQDINALAEFVSEHWGGPNAPRAALVVATDFDFGLARMYEASVSDDRLRQVQVFRDMAEAVAWVSERATSS